MTPLSIVVTAFLIALLVMAFSFMGGAVVVALPLAIVGIGTIAVLELMRRRRQARSMGALRDQADSEGVHFTERDRRTLYSK